ncbi:response regulator [Microbacterium trichothecenolyticum]|uniref:Alkanesulfonate monooxygenase SsuD/methylene tetrahydromethanopterin reductase-like flavin-dependent oxidoreductase (Luciferase family) n=1 Tax=Microbacterium trichothecenolyticum TaxID=69370 RepID=A0ABU0TYP0_MICTR|nr:response regulator [Microbacterium trichothecenolyticum]MDQ1124766.1 alkanesulfonate monooxygenase SsuD/methylene tetrahydromethanopterin reductase-like flavin-dependent oxidoreductase (luciferase family) [Microbacterium trichothecenolyticum]
MESLPLIATAVGLLVSTSVTLLGGMKWMLGRVEQRTDARFDRVDQRFALMEARFDRMDRRFDRMDERFDRMDERFDRMEASTDERFTAVGTSLAEVKIAIARLEGPRPPFLIARG